MTTKSKLRWTFVAYAVVLTLFVCEIAWMWVYKFDIGNWQNQLGLMAMIMTCTGLLALSILATRYTFALENERREELFMRLLAALRDEGEEEGQQQEEHYQT